MTESFDKMMKNLEGDGPIEKHILLLKLTKALENSPDFGDKPAMDVNSPQRIWLSEVGALLSRVSIERKIKYQTSFSLVKQWWASTISEIQGQVLDAIEELKLELELDGRSDIGSAYAPGEIYKFFADLKDIINQAEHEIMVIDPFFNGEAFDAYLSTAQSGLNIRILADRYLKEIYGYVEKHKEQFDTKIELRRSKELHDRIIIVDGEIGWVMGGSIKDAGKKATYLIPLDMHIVVSKKSIYEEIWNRSAGPE